MISFFQNENSEKLLTRKEASEYLGVKVSTLACWATNKRYNLPYVKVGRLVKYRVSDLNKFLSVNTQNVGGEDA